MNARSQRSSQKPWFMANAWQQAASRPKHQMQKDAALKQNQGEYSQIYSEYWSLIISCLTKKYKKYLPERVRYTSQTVRERIPMENKRTH